MAPVDDVSPNSCSASPPMFPTGVTSIDRFAARASRAYVRVVSSSEATICRVDEQQGDARKEDLGPSWCHLNGSIKKQPPPRESLRNHVVCLLLLVGH